MTPPSPPTTRELFTAFLSVGISGFGGVLPYARRQLVDVKRWITDAEMTELLSLAQLLPGPNIVNVAIMLGTRFRGAAGAAAGVLGLILVPLVLFLEDLHVADAPSIALVVVGTRRW